MGIDISQAIRQFNQDRGIAEERIWRTIEKTLLAAYKNAFKDADNAVVQFDEEKMEVSIFAKKRVVELDGVYDPVQEIDISEAKELNADAEPGDDILVELDPKQFNRLAIQSAKQTAHQTIRDIQKDSLYSEFKDKIGEIIIGYYQRERNGTIYVDLGKIEGVLPKKFQSPRETYHVNDRIKAYISEVKKDNAGLQVVLSRTHTEFVRAIFELEVPEIYDKTVVIHKIVREPGFRTKLAVYSNREDVDPVGACVGLKGVRIQAVIKELEGEKIDILKYDPDPERFIKNALSPAEVREVSILDHGKKTALAVVNDSALSLAIGKQGLNVRLANRLVDWTIDVKTESQFAEMDIAAESRRAVSELFGESGSYDDEVTEITRISELPGVDARVAQSLLGNGIDFIEDFLELSQEELEAKGFNASELDVLRKLIDEYAVFEETYEDEEEKVEAQEREETAESDELKCPECESKITVDMDICPSCGVGLNFVYEEEE